MQQRKTFYINFVHPISPGVTRAHQAAFICSVYESPLQMLADSPQIIISSRICLFYFPRIPTIWEDTKAITANIGEQLVIARKHGKNWYLAGLSDWNARDIEVKLDFLKHPNIKWKFSKTV
ncbi:glycoside hydrolase family 97 C-terminal domain-containing protein [Bacteroides ovatus]|nr:glycoside hydrolase family 97 C-terminal domain-containing protein [Bacteroides ovatus]